jgi:hypothetical protein
LEDGLPLILLRQRRGARRYPADAGTTALLVIDVQNTYLAPKDTPEETARWGPFLRACAER